ncbi:MAG: hypothetical protein ACREXG_06620 [Polaromonas sp.]
MPKHWIWNWLFVVAFVAVLITIGLLFDLNKSEWAAWVQAVGSIAAIVGAVWAARRQISAQVKIAQDAENLATKQFQDALRAVVDGAAKQFLKLEDEMKIEIFDDFSSMSFLFNYEEQSFTDAINALETVRLIDLGSYELVEAIAGMKAGMIKLRSTVRAAMNRERNRKEEPDHQIRDYGETLIGQLRRHYGKAANILGGEPILAWSWMDD